MAAHTHTQEVVPLGHVSSPAGRWGQREREGQRSPPPPAQGGGAEWGSGGQVGVGQVETVGEDWDFVGMVALQGHSAPNSRAQSQAHQTPGPTLNPAQQTQPQTSGTQA